MDVAAADPAAVVGDAEKGGAWVEAASVGSVRRRPGRGRDVDHGGSSAHAAWCIVVQLTMRKRRTGRLNKLGFGKGCMRRTKCAVGSS